MPDLFARVFVVFLLVLYVSVALVFIGAGIRHWFWRPIKSRIPARNPQKSFQRINSPRSEESSS